MTDLYRTSLDIILSSQSSTGAFLACASMPDYRYCWFRDGSYIAYALDLAGQEQPARWFHDWAAAVIDANAAAVERAEALAAEGLPLDAEAVLHTRYTEDGKIGSDPWPNFQLDGLGTWLWAAADHARRWGRPLPALWRRAFQLAGRYLAALWDAPNYDLWEENGDRRHTYTHAAVAAGLSAAGHLPGNGDWLRRATSMRDDLIKGGLAFGHLTKFLPTVRTAGPRRGDHRGRDLAAAAERAPEGRERAVDGALLGAALPHSIVDPHSPLMAATAAAMEADLRCEGGGVHRFAWDEYYGGGEWILLTAWLAWYYAATGRPERARPLLAWVEAQADAEGSLPEQVPAHLIVPESYDPWVARRGPIASPLLWSHAMYIVLRHALEE